ncbi:Protein FAR1-RELATED SEQUENCE 5, partial [Ananas comosus]
VYPGQEFSSLEEARNFYNKYAFKTRFSIRKSTHYKAKKQDNMITSVTYTCSKEGQCNSKLTTQEKGDHENLQNNNTSKKEISLRRTGCKAHMRVRLVNTTKWTVMTFTKEHNHELIVSPSKARFFRSHRTITKEQKELIHICMIINIFNCYGIFAINGHLHIFEILFFCKYVYITA